VDVAKITGSPVLALVVYRLRDWRHQVVEITPPVPLEGDTEAVFKRFMKILEAPVRQNVAYWDWLANTQNLVELGLLPTHMQ